MLHLLLVHLYYVDLIMYCKYVVICSLVNEINTYRRVYQFMGRNYAILADIIE